MAPDAGGGGIWDLRFAKRRRIRVLRCDPDGRRIDPSMGSVILDPPSMISRPLACELSVLAGLCVPAIFLFPVCAASLLGDAQTGYRPASRTSSPSRANMIAQNALDMWRKSLVLPLTLLFWVPPPSAEFQPVALPQCDPSLRC